MPVLAAVGLKDYWFNVGFEGWDNTSSSRITRTKPVGAGSCFKKRILTSTRPGSGVAGLSLDATLMCSYKQKRGGNIGNWES